MVSLNQIQLGFVAFIEREVAVKAVGLQKFLYYGASFLVASQMEQIFKTFMEDPMIKSMGFLDDNNSIDLNKLYNTAKYAIQKTGQITVSGVILDESDVEKLFQYIKEAA